MSTALELTNVQETWREGMRHSWCIYFIHQGELTDGGLALTQGDKLRALKSRRPPRPATTGPLRMDDMKIHSRSASQPLRLSLGATPPSPLKSSRFPSSSASGAAKRIGRSPSSTASNIRRSALGSRLASSLTDLYVEEETTNRFSSPPPPSSSSVPLSPSSSSLVSSSLCRYGNGPRGMQHEVNNNSSLFGSTAPPPGKSFVHPGPQDFSACRGPGPYSAMKGPSGRYLSRSIPVSPLTRQQLSPAPFSWLALSLLLSQTHWPHKLMPHL
nr:PREDICTED: dual specificity protein phosphatase CDC14AB-like [Paralichthys olivaceus]